jgi:hypothetical protein
MKQKESNLKGTKSQPGGAESAVRNLANLIRIVGMGSVAHYDI